LAKASAERAQEAANLEAQRKAEKARIAEAERARLEAEAAQKAKKEAEERLEKERLAEEAHRAEIAANEARLKELEAEEERLAQEEQERQAEAARMAETLRLEEERMAAAKLQAAELERQEQEMLAAQRLEAERLEVERLEQERLAQEKLAAERQAQELLEVQRLEAERLEAQRLDAEKMEQERLEAERLAQEKLTQERFDQERQEQAIVEQGRSEADRLEREAAEQRKLEAERLAEENRQAELMARDRAQQAALDAQMKKDAAAAAAVEATTPSVPANDIRENDEALEREDGIIGTEVIETESEAFGEMEMPEEVVEPAEELDSHSVLDVEDSKGFSLNQYAGKVVVMNFWFADCTICLKAIPQLNTLVTKYGAENVVFLGMSKDNELKATMAANAADFAYQVIPDAKPIAKRFMIYRYPSHLVFNANGEQIGVFNGNDYKVMEDLDRMIANEVGQ